MLYRRFGRTELSISVFSCGGMRYQQSWEDIPLSEVPAKNQENLEATIRRALEVGVNHIETAAMYGSSEIQLGQVLPKLPREKFILQSKIAPFENPDDFRKKLEESFSKLKVDRIDLLSIHGINTQQFWEWTPVCHDILLEYKEQGRIGHIGFSTHADTDFICQVIESDLFDYVNLHWYYFLQKHDKCLELAHKHDMGVFIISPSDKGGKLYDAPDKLKKLCQPYTPMQFNDLFCLHNSKIHTLSLGASRPSDFDEHVEALKFIGQEEKIQEIADKIHQALVNYHGSFWLENWDKHLPSWKDAPSHVNLYEILRFYKLAKGLDMIEFAKMRYNILEKKGHWFPGGFAQFDDNEMRQALKDSPLCEELLEALKWSHENFYSEPANDRK